MTWKNGRQLATATSSGRTVSYEYDKNGLRTSKTYEDIRYDFAYAGDKLVWQGWEGNEMYFFYDNTGAPIAFWYFPKGGTRVTSYYFTNQQGDVVRIEDPDGNVLATYAYDAWGRNYSASGSMQSINPLRYRGYYQDAETNFYYLHNRYYDPSIARFISADSYASTGQGFIGYNMFAYCGNNPVNRTDSNGDLFQNLDTTTCGGGGGAILIAAAVYGGIAIYGTVSSAIAAGQDAWNKAISRPKAKSSGQDDEKALRSTMEKAKETVRNGNQNEYWIAEYRKIGKTPGTYVPTTSITHDVAVVYVRNGGSVFAPSPMAAYYLAIEVGGHPKPVGPEIGGRGALGYWHHYHACSPDNPDERVGGHMFYVLP